jgi:hypothetical protein
MYSFGNIRIAGIFNFIDAAVVEDLFAGRRQRRSPLKNVGQSTLCEERLVFTPAAMNECMSFHHHKMT